MIRRPLCADPSLLGEKKKMEEAAAEAKEADSHSGGSSVAWRGEFKYDIFQVCISFNNPDYHDKFVLDT